MERDDGSGTGARAHEADRALWVASHGRSFRLGRDLFQGLDDGEYQLECVRDFRAGLKAVLRGNYAVCLVDYALDSRTGIELLHRAKARGCKTPIILLMPSDSESLDLEALRAGAVDSLEISQLNSASLGRSLRYAIERGRAEEELIRRENEHAARPRDEFLALAGRELKTALTPLRLQVDSLTRMLTQGRRREHLLRRATQAQRQMGRLVRFVENLVDAATIAGGGFALELEEFDLTELLEEVVSRFRYEARWSGSLLAFHSAPLAIGSWDRRRLDQVFSSLLMNALRYGCGKPIEVNLAIDEELARITVRDHGVGITPEEMGHIFSRFKDGTSVHNPSGIGLGLYLAREIAEAHGGTILVQSTQGFGSTFTVVLPRGMRAVESAGKESHHGSRPSSADWQGDFAASPAH